MASCTCDNTYQNTGKPNCENVFSTLSGFIIVPMIADDGTENYIDTTDTLDAAYFTAKLNHADPTKRWYPIQGVKNVTSEQAEAIFQEYDDNTKHFVRKGVRSYTFLTGKASTTYFGKLDSLRCGNFGLFKLDVENNLGGDLREATKLYPIEVENQSWVGQYIYGNNTPQVSGASFSFDIKQSVDDAKFAIITAAELSPVIVTSLRGLLDVYATVSNITTTSMKVKLFYDYGTAITKQPFKGAVVANFISSDSLATSKFYNVTDNADVTITSVTEVNPGEYDLTFAAQGSAEQFKILLTKNGFDFSSIDDATHVFP